MNNNKIKYFFVLSVIGLLFSCKTEVDLRAPYDDTPIIFGVLDQSVDTQYIKINKSFIGEGDNFAYASIPDCTIFKNVVATVTEANSGTVYTLKEKYIKNIDQGLFYADSQKVYYFVNDNLDQSSEYILSVNIDEGKKIITSSTEIVEKLSIASKSLLEEIKYVTKVVSSEISYGQSSIRFTAPKKEMLFSGIFRMYYDEYSTSTDITRRYVEYNLGTITSSVNTQELEFILTGENFYFGVQNDNHIKNTNINNVEKRVVRYFEYVISAANQELTTYIGLNKPTTSIAQERPTYTNIEPVGKALGVFASRYSVVVDKSGLAGLNMRLSKQSLQILFDFRWNSRNNIDITFIIHYK
jgi:hypothetical protein